MPYWAFSMCCRFMFRRKYILTLLVALSIIAVTGCSNNEEAPVGENGAMTESSQSPNPLDDNENEGKTLTKKNKEKYPTYDVNAVEQSTRVPTLKQKDSYFMSQLDEKSLIVYGEIRNAYKKYENEIVLTKTIPEKDLFKIMAIMYIDDPIMFQMKPQYDYYLDSNEYVYKLKLYYAIDKMTYKQYKTQLETAAYEMYSDITETYETNPDKITMTNDDGTIPAEESGLLTEQVAINYIRNNTASEPLDKNIDANSTPSIASVFSTQEGINSFAYAKYATYMMRYMGLDTAVVIGKPTNEKYENMLTTKSSCNFESYEDVKKVTKKSGKSKYSVSYDFNDFIAWYIVKINDSWYHCDDFYNKAIKQKNEILETAMEKDTSLTTYANDYLIAESRFFYQSDKILGDMPLCTSVQFLNSYRKGIYLLNFTEEQTVSYITDITNILKSNEVTKLLYQFETEEGYQYFISHFDEIVNAHNENSTDIIESYKMTRVPEALTVCVTDLVYK